MTTAQAHNNTCDHCMMGSICEHMPASSTHDCKLNPVIKQSHQLKRRELLYSYRDPFKCLYTVNAGAIKTFHIDMDGQERIQNFYLPGEVIGLEAIQPGYYPFSAIALIPSTVCEVTFDHLLDYVADVPGLQRRLITILGSRINLGHYVTAPHAEQRLAAFILDIVKRLNHQSASEIELPMSRYDIGNYLGLAPETISRLFTRFQQAELLHVQQKKISLLNMQKLQWIAQEGMLPGS